jgi:hypothetical protein
MLTVAVIGIAFITQEAETAAGAEQLREFIEFFALLRGREMSLVDAEKRIRLSGARGEPSFLRRAELLQVQVAYAGLVEGGGKLALGETGAARGRDRAHVDDEIDLRLRERIHHGAHGRLLVADRKKGRQCLGAAAVCGS